LSWSLDAILGHEVERVIASSRKQNGSAYLTVISTFGQAIGQMNELVVKIQEFRWAVRNAHGLPTVESFILILETLGEWPNVHQISSSAIVKMRKKWQPFAH
jgi:hypothetical protein